jgi:hypothetical protein
VMLRRFIWAGLGLALLAPVLPALSSTVTPQPRAERVFAAKDLLQQDAPLEEQSRFKNLEMYIASALHEWEPSSHLQEAVAHDIVRVALDPGEEALFPDDVNRAKTATLLASVEDHEGHGWAYVDRGVCNDPKQIDNPLLKNGNCDGGSAVSLFQIHPGRGIVLFSNGLYGYKSIEDPRKSAHQQDTPAAPPAGPAGALSSPSSPQTQVITAAELHDRLVAAKVALHMLRASLRRDGTLCEYSGEVKLCPKARKRLEFAEKWSASHAFAPE